MNKMRSLTHNVLEGAQFQMGTQAELGGDKNSYRNVLYQEWECLVS